MIRQSRGEEHRMSLEENKAIVRRAYDGFSERNLGVLDDVFAETYKSHFPGQEPTVGREPLRAVLQSFLDGFPDLKFTIEDQLAEGDRVATRWTAKGTHLGEFRGFPPRTHGIAPTGKVIHFAATDIYVITDGLIQEEWNTLEQLDVMMQLGVVPTPEQ
jgi:steroid delta-isomerase-like uncharacterized protein